jgi:carbon storage regulator
MLVLSRKVGQSIFIDDRIEVCILEVAEGSVKIGINAPKDIKILRKEILIEVQEENVESSKNIEKLVNRLK